MEKAAERRTKISGLSSSGTQNPYQDMIEMERPISKKRRKMTLEERAVQFAPFAALTGYEDCIEETIKRANEKWEKEERKEKTIE